MSPELRDKLAEVKAKPEVFDDAIVRVLQAEKPELYIRSIGSKELKPVYLAEFAKVLAEWKPEEAKTK